MGQAPNPEQRSSRPKISMVLSLRNSAQTLKRVVLVQLNSSNTSLNQLFKGCFMRQHYAGRCCYSPHFTDEETKAQRGLIKAQWASVRKVGLVRPRLLHVYSRIRLETKALLGSPLGFYSGEQHGHQGLVASW